jgi:hypothetical protein
MGHGNIARGELRQKNSTIVGDGDTSTRGSGALDLIVIGEIADPNGARRAMRIFPMKEF